jgi:hypothetical protein
MSYEVENLVPADAHQSPAAGALLLKTLIFPKASTFLDAT